jgi:hypothetical protein
VCPSVLKGSGDGKLQLIFVHFWTFVILVLKKKSRNWMFLSWGQKVLLTLVMPSEPSCAGNLIPDDGNIHFFETLCFVQNTKTMDGVHKPITVKPQFYVLTFCIFHDCMHCSMFPGKCHVRTVSQILCHFR